MKKNVCNLDCDNCPFPDDCHRPEEDLYKYPSWDPANRPPGYRQKQAEGNRKRYYDRKAAGLCVHCGCETGQGVLLCPACRARKQTHSKKDKAKKYQEHKAAGICTRCGKRPAEPGKVNCPECAEVNRQAQRKHNAKRKERKA